MAIDTSTPRTRRALLGAGLGAMAAVVASALGRPAAADAAEINAVILGNPNTADNTTSIATTDVTALRGQSGSRIGVEGTSDSDDGVAGGSNSGIGVFGASNTATAVRGISGAQSGYAAGVWGDVVSPGGVGAFGRNLATSGLAVGTQGTSHSPNGLAVVGWADAGGLAVAGYSGATFPATPRKTGVYGRADQDGTSVGVSGSSTAGRGGVFAGKLAQLRLTPSTATGHPASGAMGDFFVDKSGRLWFCKGGTTWKQLA